VSRLQKTVIIHDHYSQNNISIPVISQQTHIFLNNANLNDQNPQCNRKLFFQKNTSINLEVFQEEKKGNQR